MICDYSCDFEIDQSIWNVELSLESSSEILTLFDLKFEILLSVLLIPVKRPRLCITMRSHSWQSLLL